MSVSGAFLESTFFLPVGTQLNVRFALEEPGDVDAEAEAVIVGVATAVIGAFISVSLTASQRRRAVLSVEQIADRLGLPEDEAKQLYDSYHVATPGVALMQMANANLNPRTEAKLDPANPNRGPLLIIEGEKDHTVPWAIANASYKRQKRNPSVTEIKKMPNRGHSLTIDHGWQEVAQTALEFVKRFVPAKPS